MFTQWYLCKAPLSCREEILEQITLTLCSNGLLIITNTNNEIHGNFTLNSDYINLNFDTCNKRVRHWRTFEELHEANIADTFVDSLANKDLEYKLNGDTLIILHEGQEYEFKICQYEI